MTENKFNPVNPQQSNQQNQPQMNAVLQQQIVTLVAEQVTASIQLLNNSNDASYAGSNIVIEDRHRNNLDDLDRIPDIVLCLREFSGNPV